MWSKLWKILIPMLLAVALVFGGASLWLCYHRAENTMDGSGELVLRQRSDGILLEWPRGENASHYLVELLKQDSLLFKQTTENCSCLLPLVSADTVRITSFQTYLGQERPGTQVLERKIDLTPPAVDDLQYRVEGNSVLLSYTASPGSFCMLYRAGTQKPAAQSYGGEMTLTLDDLPAHGQQLDYSIRVIQQNNGVTYYGQDCAGFSLTRQDFLTDTMELTMEDLGQNRYALRWNETKGSGYCIECSEDGGTTWTELARVASDAQRCFETGRLESVQNYQFRVTALTSLVTANCTVETGISSLYCTIWPLMDLTVYRDAGATQAAGTAAAGTAFCVLEQSGEMFGVYFDGAVGYIDSSYCMINLPEYIGELCAYQITNSYDSLYKVHGYEIPQITSTVVCGYEDVAVGDGYLVPLLYPAAQKLIAAAMEAREQGYRLRIFDSFRPHMASSFIYQTTEALIYEPIPGMERSYWSVMTKDGEYRLRNFLAKSISKHNLGIAMDLTLETLDGEQIPMQTDMHDLSWYSVVDRNNESADLLRELMVEAGFATLFSEWWHFQDSEAFDKLGLEPLEQGVCAQCWWFDDTGCRYRLADGSYLSGGTYNIDGKMYTFDSNGYVTAE